MKLNKVIGAGLIIACLVVGSITSVLVVWAKDLGLIGMTTLLLGACIIVTIAAFKLIEVLDFLKISSKSLGGVARAGLGNGIGITVAFCCLLILAYQIITTISPVLTAIVWGQTLKVVWVPQVLKICLAVILCFAVYVVSRGAKAIDLTNRFWLALALAGLVFASWSSLSVKELSLMTMLPSMELFEINQLLDFFGNYGTLVIIPLGVFSSSCLLLPALYHYLDRDKNATKQAVLVGMVIALVVLCWLMIVAILSGSKDQTMLVSEAATLPLGDFSSLVKFFANKFIYPVGYLGFVSITQLAVLVWGWWLTATELVKSFSRASYGRLVVLSSMIAVVGIGLLRIKGSPLASLGTAGCLKAALIALALLLPSFLIPKLGKTSPEFADKYANSNWIWWLVMLLIFGLIGGFLVSIVRYLTTVSGV